MTLSHNSARPDRPKKGRICRRILLLALFLAAVVIAVGLCWRSCFVVDETQVALVLSFGRQVRGPITEAGVHLKRPWQTVRQFDRRLQLLEFEPREKLVYDHEPVVVQPFACWRIAPEGVERYLKSVENRTGAESLLTDMIWSALDHELSTHALTDWVNTNGEHSPAGLHTQTQIMDEVACTCQQEARRYFGIELLDVRLRRLTRPEWMNEDIYRRMIADRKRTANRLRRASTARVTQIESSACQEVDRLLAEAKKQAREIHAQSKAQAEHLYSEAHRLDPELTALVEKLESYRRLLDGKAMLILSGDPDVFGVPNTTAPAQQPAPTSQVAPVQATRPGG